MSPLLPTYLKALRKRWCLTQVELAGLLGITESALCKVETLASQPSLHFVIGTEVIFGQGARQTFPALYANAERNIIRRAEVMSARFDGKQDQVSHTKRQLLGEMIDRSVEGNKHL
jgi:DNA-binding XRE family transcriptional regulator